MSSGQQAQLATYNTSQKGSTILLRLKKDLTSENIATIRQQIKRHRQSPPNIPKVHFLSVSLISLTVESDQPTHIIIESNYDDSFDGFVSSWFDNQQDLITELLDVSEDTIDQQGGLVSAREVSRLFAEHDINSGTYYIALSGLSVEDIKSNQSLTEQVKSRIRDNRKKLNGMTPSDIFSFLREDVSTDYPKRSYFVRYGPMAFAVARKILLALLIFCVWAATRLWGNDKADFSTHTGDILRIFFVAAIVIAAIFFWDKYRQYKLSKNKYQLSNEYSMSRLSLLYSVGIAAVLLYILNIFDISNAMVVLLYVLCALVWPGAAIFSVLSSNHFSPSDETLRRFLRWSVIGITILLLFQLLTRFLPVTTELWTLLERSTSLLIGIYAVSVTVIFVLFEIRYEEESARFKLSWVFLPLVAIVALTLTQKATSIWLVIIIAIVVLIVTFTLHWLFFQFANVRHDERSQRASKMPASQNLNVVLSNEDQSDKVQNHLVSVTRVDPKRVKALAITLFLLKHTIKWKAHTGTLMGIPSIHFARWVMHKYENNHYLLFLSNYSGPFDSYLDEFIDNAAPELNLVWGPTIGYPRTYWMVGGGAYRSEEFKRYARSSQAESLYHYSAYPELTVDDIEDQIRIKKAIAAEAVESEEADLLRVLQ